MTCTTASCKPYHLKCSSRVTEIPKVRLIEGISIYEYAYPLVGTCSICSTRYYADHETYSHNGQAQEVFLNSAAYLKIGTSLWVDRTFSTSVYSGIYNFHASANAYTQYWNSTFGIKASDKPLVLGRKQV